MKEILVQLLEQALMVLQQESEFSVDLSDITIQIDRTKEKQHGDYATNLPLLLAKPYRQPPRKIAEMLIENLPTSPIIEKIEIAGAGFINFFMRRDALNQVIPEILEKREAFGKSDLGKNQKVLLEFVSANPTGPLHVGHGRSAAFGSSLANVLTAAGYKVDKEYYVNDAGRQMNILAVSIWLRYLTLTGNTIVFPTNAYKGDYVNEISNILLDKQGTIYVYPWSIIEAGLPPDEPQGGDKELYIDALISKAKALLGQEGFHYIHQLGVDSVSQDIKSDLSAFGVEYERWFSEFSLTEDHSIDKGIQALKDAGHTYEKEDALWFKATDFGDEKDRVLIRSNGDYTYFASDVAYHWNKYDRGYDRVIDIFGADHHGYISRIRSAVKALGHDEKALDILLVQFAILYRSGERLQMSTRSGSFVTLRELREEVGNDAARFFYVTRKPEQHMDFDLDLAKSQSNDNPVYYIQYAHARICSILRQLKERELSWNQDLGIANLSLLELPQERALILLLGRYSETIEAAATTCEPHQLAYYLRDLAHGLHSYYNAVTLLCDDEALRGARLCLLKSVRQVIYNGLTLLGVQSPESM